MTRKIKLNLVLGLMVWGFLAFLPNFSYAVEVESDDVSEEMRDEEARRQATQKGYGSKNIISNISAIDNEDIEKNKSNLNKLKKKVARRSGAINAAAARWKGSDTLGEKIVNTASGAVKDIFRNDREIAESLEDFETEENKENIQKATKAAQEIEKQKVSKRIVKKGAMVYDANGQKIYLDKNMKAIGGVMDGCVPLPIKLEQSKKCLLCPLFLILFNTAQSMSVSSYNMLAEGFKNLLLIGFALYVAFVTLKQVSSFTKQDGPKYISTLLVMSFKVLLAYLILLHVEELYSLVLEPLLKAAMEFGGAFLFRSADTTSSSNYGSCIYQNITNNTIMIGDEEKTIVQGYYSPSLFAKINCFITSVQQEISVATSIGSSMMCVARNEAAKILGIWDFSMFFSGLFVWIFSWLISLAFGFYLVDAVVRLGVVGGLMPFLIAAWPFKITSGFTKKGWEMFLNTFFIFVFIGMVVSINIELAMQSITGGEGGEQKILELVSNNEIQPIIDIMEIGMAGILFLILCSIFGFLLCSQAVSLAGQLGAGSGGNIGSTIASGGANAAKWGAQHSARLIGKTAFLAGEGLGINDGIRSKKELVTRKFFSLTSKIGGSLGFKGATGNNNNREDSETENTQGGARFFENEKSRGTDSKEKYKNSADKDAFDDKKTGNTATDTAENQQNTRYGNFDNTSSEENTFNGEKAETHSGEQNPYEDDFTIDPDNKNGDDGGTAQTSDNKQSSDNITEKTVNNSRDTLKRKAKEAAQNEAQTTVRGKTNNQGRSNNEENRRPKESNEENRRLKESNNKLKKLIKEITDRFNRMRKGANNDRKS